MDFDAVFFEKSEIVWNSNLLWFCVDRVDGCGDNRKKGGSGIPLRVFFVGWCERVGCRVTCRFRVFWGAEFESF